MPIIASTSVARREKRVYYFDGFAGPGEYEGKEPGSPQVALRVALDHSQVFPVPIHMTFIEDDADRAKHLEGVLDRYRPDVETSRNVELHKHVRQGDCARHLDEIIGRLKATGRTMPPCLFFLDQWGYSMVPMEMLGQILRHRWCEVFALIEWNRLNHTMTDPNKWPAITRAFGDSRWRPALDFSGARRQEHLVNAYRRAMEEAGAKYTWHFSMRDGSNKLIYWLFFGSGGIEGLAEMKKAMGRVDPSGGYTFSDFHEGRGQRLLFEYSPSMLAEDLAQDLKGQKLRVSQVRHHVLTRTPGVTFNAALTSLEKTGRVVVENAPPGRRAGWFVKYQTDKPPLTLRFV